MTGGGDAGSSSGGSPLPPPELTTLEIAGKLLSVAVLLLPFALVVGLVVSLCARSKKARRNKEERRRLKKRVTWLRHLLPLLLLHPASEEENINDDESGGATTTTATAQAVRTVLARRLDATLGEAKRLATGSSSWGLCCGLARCHAQARKLERAAAAVDEVYVQVLPVVTQIDATQSVVQMLGARQHMHGGDDGLANRHTRTPSMQGPDGRTELDWQPLLSDEVDDQEPTGTETTAACMTGPGDNEASV